MKKGFFRIRLSASICWGIAVASIAVMGQLSPRIHPPPGYTLDQPIDPAIVKMETILTAAPVADSVRAEAWDAYQVAADPPDLAARLGKLALPYRVKTDLLDAMTPPGWFARNTAVGVIAGGPPLLLYLFGFQVFPWIWRGFGEKAAEGNGLK
jgi:hypothetical protein